MRPKKKKFLQSGHGKEGYRYRRRTKDVESLFEDGVGKKVSMSRIHRKSSNNIWMDHIGGYANYEMIQRMLDRNLGRLWSDVYGELCKKCDLRTYEGRELRDAIDCRVETNCRIENGHIVDERGSKIGPSHFPSWYVHPKTGILSKVKETYRWNRYPRDNTQRVFESEGKYFHQHEGIWYEVQMTSNFWGSDSDVFGRHYGECRFYGLSPEGKSWVPIKKRSANSREIKKIKSAA